MRIGLRRSRLRKSSPARCSVASGPVVVRSVQGDDVGFGGYVGQRGGAFFGLDGQMAVAHAAFVSRRVAEQEAYAAAACHEGHLAAHVADAYDAQGGVPEVCAACGLEQEQRRLHVLCHAAGVAARAVAPAYAGVAEIMGVNVVMSDGGRGYKPDAAALEQAAVATGAGADDKGVGPAHVIGGYGAAG